MTQSAVRAGSAVTARDDAPRKAMRALIICLLSAAACQSGPSDPDGFPQLPAGTRAALIDVALVWPLPPGTGAASGAGFLGPVLTCEQLAVFEPLTRTDEPAVLCEALTVTAVRLDPCARVGGATSSCTPQVRLVLQPVVDGDARDASIHAFYVADEETVARAVARLMALRIERNVDGSGPLGVHPLLLDVDGRHAVVDVVGDALGAARLDHFTQITVHGNDEAWTFETRVFVDGAPSDGEALQQHVLSPRPTPIAVTVTPLDAHADDFGLLLDAVALQAAAPSDIQAAYDRAARVEHPLTHDQGTVDCARCHLAAPARAAAEAAMAGVATSPEAFTSPRHDLARSAVFANAQFIHALAWRHRELAVNGRVVHEAAVSADLIEPVLTRLGALP
jgi:hypothetical protein